MYAVPTPGQLATFVDLDTQLMHENILHVLATLVVNYIKEVFGNFGTLLVIFFSTKAISLDNLALSCFLLLSCWSISFFLWSSLSKSRDLAFSSLVK